MGEDVVTRPRRLLSEPSATVAAGVRRLLRGRAGEGLWLRPALVGVLVLTAALYIWGLDRNGYANSYYSAAVLAGTKSWKAFFFGSFDAGNFITVDKPPASLWLMDLSGRIFGVSSWSLLLPQALLGVATAGVLFATVRRVAGPVAGLIAALVAALTPVAVLMFRFNNPDALLTFLLVAAAWALLRSLETGRTRWLLISAAIVGLAFLTKYLAAYIVLPAFILTYLLLGPGGWLRRIGQLLGAAAVLVVSSGWWVAVAEAIPAAARPFIGGSTNNSVLNLIFGYDGFGRITGALGGLGRGAVRGFGGGGPAGGFGGGGGGFGGQPGLLRLFNSDLGGEISWLLPLAAAALVAGFWLYRRSPRTNLARASYLLWGLWLGTHAVVFSFASGIFHPYYAVVMAPAVGALVGPGVVDLWRLHSRSLAGGLIGAVALPLTAWWGSQLLARTPDFMPGLGTAELALAAIAAALLLAAAVFRWRARVAAAALGLGLVAVLVGPSAYAVATAGRAEQGAIPSSGPATAAAFGPGGGRFVVGDYAGQGFGGGGLGGGRFGGDTSPALLAYLEQHQGKATWLVATASANGGDSIELATGRPVLAMGGFSGSDPAMTVARLKQLVSSGQLRYVLVGGGGGGGGGRFGSFGDGGAGPAGGPGGGGDPAGGQPFAGAAPGAAGGSQTVMTWVTQNCKAVDYSGSGSASSSGLYDCSSAVIGAS